MLNMDKRGDIETKAETDQKCRKQYLILDMQIRNMY